MAGNRPPGICPFCEGNEGETPHEIVAVRPSASTADAPGWTVRVFENRYPVVSEAQGRHEVIVATPRHVTGVADLTDVEAAAGAIVWSERLRAAARDRRRLWPLCFVNQGAAGGASLSHAHAQLVGLPYAPPRLAARERAFAEHGPGVLGDPSRSGRLVAERASLVAYVPEVSPLARTIRVVPRSPAPSPPEHDAGELGVLLRDLARAARVAAETDALNICLYVRPQGGTDRYCWHAELIPRRGALAGLEVGSGANLASADPGEAALEWRGALERVV